MVLSFLVTYGGKSSSHRCLFICPAKLTFLSVYLCSSVIAFDAWHMLTSFGPYLLLSPTYVNILGM